MNREKARRLLPLIIAFANGEKLQTRPNEGAPWESAPEDLLFGRPVENYRLAPPTVKKYFISFSGLKDPSPGVVDTVGQIELDSPLAYRCQIKRLQKLYGSVQPSIKEVEVTT